MKRVTIILIAFCLAGFVAVALQGIQFMNTPAENKELGAEGFTAVTRASDCNCLPGYIPSNQTDGGFDGRMLQYNGGPVYNPNNTGDLYYINNPNINCNLMPGIPPNAFDWNNGDYNQIMNYWTKFMNYANSYPNVPKNGYRVKGPLTCDIVKKKLDTNENYFCQSLTDPLKTRKCY